jgi:hypothetical protein
VFLLPFLLDTYVQQIFLLFCRYNCQVFCRAILNDSRFQPQHIFDKDAYSGLHLAVRFGNWAVADVLLKDGRIDPRLSADTDLRSPLNLAILNLRDSLTSKSKRQLDTAWAPSTLKQSCAVNMLRLLLRDPRVYGALTTEDGVSPDEVQIARVYSESRK